MASLLRSWVLLAAIWGVGQLLLSLLVLRQVELTAAALWTTALVSACQALALESLAAPLGFGLFLRQAAGSLRRRPVWILWLFCGAAVATAHLLADGGAFLLSSLVALLAVLAAGLFAFAAWRPEGLRAARPALGALSVLLLLSAAEAASPWLSLLPAWLLPQWPQGPARSLLTAIFVAALYSALFRSQRRIAGRSDTASGWLAAAAGAGALGVVASLLPLRLMTSLQDAPSLGPGMLLVLVTGCLATAGICLLPGVGDAGTADPLDPDRVAVPRLMTSPGLGAVALIAALSAVFGLVVAHSVITLPVELTARGALVLGMVIAGQALAWYWLRARERPIVAAARRLVAAHPGLALWTAAEGVGLVVLWLQRTAGWSRIAPIWEIVAIYGGVRAALLALLTVGLMLRRSENTPATGFAASAAHAAPGPRAALARLREKRPLRALLLAAALATPALLPLVGSRPAWQNAVAAGLLALSGLAVAAPAGPALDGWFGLALLLVWPAAALAIATLALGEAGLPLTSPIALTSLLPALGLAALAAPALFAGPRDGASS